MLLTQDIQLEKFVTAFFLKTREFWNSKAN